MIHIKNEQEIVLIKKACQIVTLTHEYIKDFIKVGISTEEINNLAHDFIIKNSATPAFLGYHDYPKSVCISVNDVVVHGIPNKKKILKDKDIVSVDIGVNYQGYYGDAAWTYPVGDINQGDCKLLEVTKSSLYAGIMAVKPGNRVSDISKAIENYVVKNGFSVVEEFSGHGIGKNLHEDPNIPNFYRNDLGPLLKPGMILCIEPMVNAGKKGVKILSDNWTAVTVDRKRSAHFEHQVLVTDDGYEILTVHKGEHVCLEKT